MMAMSGSNGVVVVMGDPTDDERCYMDDLVAASHRDGTFDWNVPSKAEVGDRVVVYLTKPVSAIVAYGDNR